MPQVLYRDLDGDGIGGTEQEDLAEGCPPLDGYSTLTGDCHDELPSPQDPADDVFPGQPEFFTLPYPTASGLSFDYDCSGTEEAGPGMFFVPALTDCAERTLPCGSDVGYRVPANPRTGDGVNPLCGTRDMVNCSAASLGTCNLVTVAGASPFPCR